MARKPSVSLRARALVLGLVAVLVVTSEGVASAVPAAPVVVAAPSPADPALTPQDVAPLGEAAAEPDAAEPAQVWGEFTNDPTAEVQVAPPMEEIPVEARDLTGFEPGRSQVAQRYENADVYANPDGSYTVRAVPGQLNTKDSSGELVPIDAAVRPADPGLDTPVTRDALGTSMARQLPALTTGAHPLRPVFGATAKGGAVSVMSNETAVVVTPVDAPDDDGQGPQLVDGDVVFTRASAGSDLVYEVTKESVKETIMLRGPPGAAGVTAWSFWLDITGGRPTLVKSGAIEIINEAGQLAVALPVPYVTDSAGVAGARETNDINGRYLLEQVDGRWRVTVEVDRDWLNRKDLRYPVRVDPTIPRPTGRRRRTRTTGW